MLLAAGASPPERVREIFGTPTLGIFFLTALEMASALGRARLVRLLLARLKGMSPTGVVIEGCNETELLQGAMIQGATYGQPTVVAEFLNVFTCSDETSIHVLWAAADRWEIDVVDLILRRFRFQQPVLAEALNRAMEGKTRRTDEYGTDVTYHDNDADKHYRVVTRLIGEGNLGAHVAKNAPRFLQQAIFEMVRKGGLRALLDKGVNPNLRLENGCTALHVFAAPINFSDWKPEDPEMIELGTIHEDGIRILRKGGASIKIMNDNGETPSQWAAEMAYPAVFARYYLPAHQDLLCTNQYGETLLHYAAAGGKHETVEFLLSLGIFDVNATSKTSWTPLLCALAPNNRVHKTEVEAVRTARVLLRHGADTRAVTAEGLTVLHLLGSHLDLSEKIRAEKNCWSYEFEYRDVLDMGWEPAVPEDDQVNAAVLARELLSGSHELPPMQSPATVLRSDVGSDDQDTRSEKSDVWGGRLSAMLAGSSSAESLIHGRTPLHWAAERGAAGVARALCELGGADPQARDSDGKLPLDLVHWSPFISNRSVMRATKRAVK